MPEAVVGRQQWPEKLNFNEFETWQAACLSWTGHKERCA